MSIFGVHVGMSKAVKGGFFLRSKPLEDVLPDYTKSENAAEAEMNYADLTYRRTAVAGASGFALLIAIYDTLAGDLRRAAVAQRAGNLEKRAREVKHALLVVSYLQNLLEPESGELAVQLDALYSKLRRGIVAAQAKQSAEMLEGLMAEVLELRRIWQQFEARGAEDGPEILPPLKRAQYPGFTAAQFDRSQMSWSA